MRPYTDKPKPTLFPLRIEEQPHVDQNFNDILTDQITDYNNEVNPKKQKEHDIKLTATKNAIQQSNLGGQHLINLTETEIKDALKLQKIQRLSYPN